MPTVEVIAVTSLIDQSRVQAALEGGASGTSLRDAPRSSASSAAR
jgi:hypothetical protein